MMTFFFITLGVTILLLNLLMLVVFDDLVFNKYFTNKLNRWLQNRQ